MTSRGAPAYSQEVYDRFLELYPKLETLDCIAQLAKEFPAVRNNCKPRPYWNKLALRYGMKRNKLPKPEKGKAEQEVESASEPVEMEIKVDNPSVALPDTIIFGAKKYPVAAIRAFRAGLIANLSLRDAMEQVRKKHPEVGDISESVISNFFRLRLGLTSRLDMTAISDEKFEELLRQQIRNYVICSLYEQKWRESAIVEKVVEMFPDLAAPAPEMIKHLVSHRRTKVRYKKRDKKIQANAEKPIEKVRRSGYFVQLKGPKINYEDELTEPAAKSLLKTLLNI